MGGLTAAGIVEHSLDLLLSRLERIGLAIDKYRQLRRAVRENGPVRAAQPIIIERRRLVFGPPAILIPMGRDLEEFLHWAPPVDQIGPVGALVDKSPGLPEGVVILPLLGSLPGRLGREFPQSFVPSVVVKNFRCAGDCIYRFVCFPKPVPNIVVV